MTTAPRPPLNEMLAQLVEIPSLARFLPKAERAEGSECEILAFQPSSARLRQAGGALLSAHFVTLSREVTTHEDP